MLNLIGNMWNTILKGVNAVPRTLFVIAGSFLISVLGAATRGEWMLIAIGVYKEWEQRTRLTLVGDNNTEAVVNKSLPYTGDDPTHELLVQLRLEYVHWFILASMVTSYVSYFSLGGFLQYYFYYLRKDKAEEWKCQPNRWLTKANERHEIFMGSANMAIGATVSGIIASYVYNGGACKLYYSALERGWFYLIFSVVVCYIIQEGLGYYSHRNFHQPYFYRWIHKWHHRYYSPTVWSSTAMHPLEFLTYQITIVAPIFILPIYSGAFIVILLYIYYHGLLAHSGIKFKSVWPWQPASIYHDDHHKYFHTNFGQNMHLFDWLHDTMRKQDRIYGEEVFGGKGKARDKTN